MSSNPCTDLCIIGISTVDAADSQKFQHLIASRVGPGTGSMEFSITELPADDYYLSATLVDETGGVDSWTADASNPVTVTD